LQDPDEFCAATLYRSEERDRADATIIRETEGIFSVCHEVLDEGKRKTHAGRGQRQFDGELGGVH
jgi:hypothetical protein